MPCRSPLASWFCGGFSCLVFPEHRLCLLDIGLLSPLRAAAQQDDQRVAILGQIDPIARSPINAALGDDADPLHARCVARCEPQRRRGDLRCYLGIEPIEPGSVGARAIRAKIFDDPHLYRYPPYSNLYVTFCPGSIPVI